VLKLKGKPLFALTRTRKFTDYRDSLVGAAK
jgi:hypothetical protein